MTKKKVENEETEELEEQESSEVKVDSQWP
jgi:ATP-binding cassette subfamily C (CFTR/MRP) protein 1